MLRLLVPLCLVVSVVRGHSWLVCTDYLEENGHYYKPDICRAYPRAANRYAAKDLHITKNHGADLECTNPWIPDNANKIFFSSGNTDPALSVLRKNLLVDLGVSPVGQGADTQTYPKQGYQNAPKFCEGTDKAMGTFAFDFPKMPAGRYTFVWEWEFNKNSFYTSCWEADVVDTKSERDAILRQRGLSTNDPSNLAGVKVPVSGYGQYKPPTGTQAPVTPRPVDPSKPAVTVVTGKPLLPAIDGAWGPWKAWGKCSATCGTGTERRVRFCDSPAPQNGGSMCVGSDEETRPCDAGVCPQTSLTDLQVNIPSSWDTGTNGLIMLPNPKPTGNWKVILKLPCDVQNLNVWHGNDVTTAEHRARGVFAINQSGWMLDKPDIGFTAFYSGTCQMKGIKASIES
ncbi:uncharacterized protein LOC106157477 [Lingula anatina]|uniref:Uncharacterized protein LOC106157477 n=1 Tax=Lingula anatina TaxID=7574 RepID=A0A1S3HU67_LINAN|nr:uncharacterized protein LOC106157477 [Lingula anatina]|eukprot:XP_013388599.1 uncharacterized protein LOC106157477 [Lingula anatina]